MAFNILSAIRSAAPLVHCITNYVTVNDTANVLLAAGARPIMADDPAEAEEIAALCAGLCINIGTLNARTIPAMTAAGRRAHALGRPVVLDPVGAGASRLRTETARDLLCDTHPAAVRGNISEIRALAAGTGTTAGVDASAADAVTEENLAETAAFIRAFAAEHHCIAAVTGAVDIVTDGAGCYAVRNGRAEMSRVTGTGCQLSALTAAALAAAPGRPLEAALTAVVMMGTAGEIAWERMGPGDGNAAYRAKIIDAIYCMDEETLAQRAKIECV